MANVMELIDASRIVVVCASFRVGQLPVLGPAEIERLTGRYLINTARGELVDEPALLAAIRDNRLAGVATDVVADEYGPNRLPEWRTLAAGRNVILTPHIGGATRDAMARTECFIADKLVAEVARQETST
jgi:D-3-phosphoglycerate dehydrogenase